MMNGIFLYLKFKNLSKNWEKYIFHLEKWYFEPTGNSLHIEESLVFGEVLNIFINYLMLYPGRHVGQVAEMKLSSIKFNAVVVVENYFFSCQLSFI